MTDEQKVEVKDAHELDKKIPRDLIIMYQNKPYITKAGLCWKMNYLFGGNNWGVTSEIIERSNDYVLVKSILKTKEGMEFSNYGEASKLNVSNPQMHKYLLHLAVTRAENRVIRTATACGYTSIEEMSGEDSSSIKEIPISNDDNKPITEAQKKVIENLGGNLEMDMTQKDAKEAIAILVQKK